jgi:type I restriction enzyme S subunit
MTIWPRQPIGSLGSVITGSTPKTSEESFYGGAIPFVTPSELDQIEPISTAARTLSQMGGREVSLLPEDAVMVCCIGSLGKVGIAGRTVATNQQINSVVFNTQHIWPRFGFHACRLLKSKLEMMAPATTLPIVSKSKFERLEIPVPPLAEQRRIAAILDQAEVLRAKRRAAFAQLDPLAHSIFLELFGDPTTNYKSWPTRALASLVRDGDTINYGVVQPGDDSTEGIPLVRVGDLIEGRVSHAALKRIAPTIEANYKRSRLHGDELLVSCVGSIGIVAMADDSINGFNIARAVARIPLATATNRFFVAEYLKSDFVQRYFRNELRTVSQPTLNIKQLSETTVILPPLALQCEFARRVAAVERLKTAHRASLAETDSLFASLQHRAFRGQL